MLTGGLGYVAITFTGLTSPSSFTLSIDDQRCDQSIHGNDFWQTDYDAASQQWSRTYNIPIYDAKSHSLRFTRTQ